MRIPIAILTLCIILSDCSQSKNSNIIKGLTIDPKIKPEVEKHIEDSKEFDAFKNKMEVYANSMLVESFENDSLIFRSTDSSKKQIFKSFYLWKNDTLTIDGAFGLFGGIGFGIDIIKNNATLYHMLSSDDFPEFAYNEKDSLVFRLQVPCTGTKIVLSEIPDSAKSQVIYGYVEFKSANYFAENGQQDGHEIFPRQKLRNNMRIYFRSSRLSL
ncbi:hypothetical protein [Flavitalea sp. BT771]|uniref:hypothetical protein n=1 Tax=Flavitalea sp. BT771 TaxID=3063329 RepID=UPI0026E3E2BC|nr:hypothetical protein [Flavitalea sp. BT771]